MRRRVKISMIFGLIAASLLTTSCSKSSGDEPTSYEQIYFNITRATTVSYDYANPTTYNFTLFGGSNTSYSGTYRTPISADEDEVGILFPCAVSSSTGLVTSTSMDVDTSKGLTAPAGSYQMVVVSPAIGVETLDADYLGEPRVGFKIDRHLLTSGVDLFIKEYVSVSINGVEIDGEKEYLFDDDSDEFHRPRSKLILYVKSTDNTEHIIKDIYLSSVMNTGYYNPTAGYYRATTEEIRPYDSFFEYGDLTVDNSTTLIGVDSNHKTTATDSDLEAIYLIANDCSGGESTYVAVPNLVIDLIRGTYSESGESTESTENTESTTITIPLQYNFKRSYYYEFTVNISSTSVTLTGISVAKWDEVNGGEVGVENLTPIVVSLSEPGDWDAGNEDNCTTTFQ